MSKKYIILSLLIFSYTIVFSATKNPFKDSTTIEVSIENISDKDSFIDSVYMVFDRYDRSGAGVIKQIFYPDHNTVKITVPRGKYYVNIVCLGMCTHQSFDKIINAKTKKENRIFLKVRKPALFTPGLVYIPEEKVDPENLLVTSYASYKYK